MYTRALKCWAMYIQSYVHILFDSHAPTMFVSLLNSKLQVITRAIKWPSQGLTMRANGVVLSINRADPDAAILFILLFGNSH